MKIISLSLVIFLLNMAYPVFGQAGEQILHSSDPILFEVVEDGVTTNKRVSLEINAHKNADGVDWAECLIVMIESNNKKKRTDLYMYHSSTDNLPTIKNLSISPLAVSFEMTPFPLAPDRPLRFVATRKDPSSYAYEANAVGLWTGLFDKTKLLKVEWRQVPSIALHYPAIGK